MPSNIRALVEKRRLHKRIREAVTTAVNSAYGTDDRHELLGAAVADLVVDEKPLPWDLGKSFGRAS